LVASSSLSSSSSSSFSSSLSFRALPPFNFQFVSAFGFRPSDFFLPYLLFSLFRPQRHDGPQTRPGSRRLNFQACADFPQALPHGGKSDSLHDSSILNRIQRFRRHACPLVGHFEERRLGFAP
jgi:hypothetical protein